MNFEFINMSPRLEKFLIAFVMVLFCISAAQGMYVLHIDLQDAEFRAVTKTRQDFVFLFFSFLTMVIAGVGLAVMFFMKYRLLKSAAADKKRMMKLLEQRLAAMEAAGDGIGIVDSDGNLTYMNKALMELHGLAPEDAGRFIGHSWHNLYTAKGRSHIAEVVMPALEEKGYWKGDTPLLRRDGAVAYSEMSLTLLPEGGMIGTARDITDRKQAEDEREELQKQFFQAQKMEAIGRLAGGIAHDFNNILAAMLGYTEFLIDDLEQETAQYNFARNIMSGGQQARQLVDQILTFSRRNEGDREVINAVSTVHETLGMLKSTMPAKVALDTNIDMEEAPVYGNPVHIGQVLMNICVNALDAMEGGDGHLVVGLTALAAEDAGAPHMLSDGLASPADSPAVRVATQGDTTTIELGSLARGRDYISLSVSDTGCGMTREVMEHIFEPFFTTKTVDHGSGLGLSSALGIITAHQAGLVVSSAPGEGTVFRLYFPVSERQIEAPADHLDDMDEDGAGHILIVEDEPLVRAMMTSMLDRMGYETTSCRDGDEAVACVCENPGVYDLILSDYMMPRVTGIEMAALLLEGDVELPVILVSGHVEKKLKQVAQKCRNIKAVMRKPLNSRDLRKTIRKVLRDTQNQGETQRQEIPA